MDPGDNRQLETQDFRFRERETDKISAVDIVAVLLRHWRLIVITTAFSAAVVFVILVYGKVAPAKAFNPVPDVFTSRALVLIHTSSGGSSLTGGSSGTASLASLLGAGAGTTTPQEADAALAESLLRQNAIVDQLVKDFHIMQKYHFTSYQKEKARAKMIAGLATGFNPITGILTLSYTSVNPKYATSVVNEAVDLLEKRFNTLTQNQILTKVSFLQQQVDKAQTDLQNAENRLVAFQNKYQILDIGTQTSAAAQRLSGYRNQLLQLELQRQNMLVYFKPDYSGVVRIDNEIRQLRKLMNEVETGSKIYSVGTIPLDEVAQVGVNYQNLQTEAQLQGKLYQTLREEYETAKIQLTDNSGIFQVIQHGEVPEQKSGPSRSKIAIFITLLALFLSLLAAFIIEYVRRLRQDPAEFQKFRAIRGYIHRSSR